MKLILAAAAAATFSLASADAGVITLTVTEENGNVVVHGSGSVDTSGQVSGSNDFLTDYYTYSETTETDVSESAQTAAYGMGSGWGYVFDDSSTDMGSAVLTNSYADFDASGDKFGFNVSFSTVYGFSSASSSIFFDENADNPEDLEFTWTFLGETIESLGTVFGYVFATDSNAVRIVDGRKLRNSGQGLGRFGDDTVPLPAAFPLFLTAMAAFGALRQKRRPQF